MSYPRESVKPMSLWTHNKKGGLYIVFGIGTCSTNGPNDGVEQSVWYYSVLYQSLRYREVNEFLDGRFTPLEDKSLPPTKFSLVDDL